MSETELNIEQIWDIIPHRYPFLLVDRVTEINGFESIKGYKNITINELVFQGHFPVKPVFPGVLILEAMAQLGAILILRKFPPEKRMAYFTGIDNARFKHSVIPGDKLEMEVFISRDRNTFVVMEGKAFVCGKLAAQATMSSVLAK
ncbi:MAG: 3-hydroxyacyl-ACP dehydratase FabZ [Acidobacteria bacterium]|jgi:3-hydroxyacyl-[acyl-carrier-protein] dehydratase|nr:3-hydroxyacyl-ACP dehydratase FabZ [Acidobacteriota bacterium]